MPPQRGGHVGDELLAAVRPTGAIPRARLVRVVAAAPKTAPRRFVLRQPPAHGFHLEAGTIYEEPMIKVGPKARL